MPTIPQRFFNSFKPFLLTKSHCVLPRFIEGRLLRAVYLARFSRWVKSIKCPVLFAKRPQLFEHIWNTQNVNAPIDYLEFGVRQGGSIKAWIGFVTDPGARFFGFDTFTGLPEDWGVIPAGTLSTSGQLPDVRDSRCEFVVGLFQDTLGAFLRDHTLTRRKVVMLDADLYSSTLFALTMLAPYLHVGDVLIFDELGSTRMPDHEFRALDDFLSSFGFRLECIGAAKFYAQMAFVISYIPGRPVEIATANAVAIKGS